MRVHPSQLVPGCILLEDVKGKTGRPFMRANTVLSQEHITILHKFFIDSVDVSSTLEDGTSFKPETMSTPLELPAEKKRNPEIYLEKGETRSFPVHYLEVVKEYKQNFRNWSSGVPIDIASVRRSIIPLLERIEDVDIEIFTLHQYAEAADYTYHHSVAVSLISALIGKELGYRKGEWIQLGLAGYLCDAGMTRIDPDILTAGGPLSAGQLQDIKNHSTYSYRMTEKITGLSQTAKIAILQHHERLDGSGYPLGLKGQRINPFARIIAVADTYHAMTSERLYKGKYPIFKVVREMMQEQHFKLDAEVVQVFVSSLRKKALGKTVHLTNHTTGEIVYFDDAEPSRPIVKLHGEATMIGLQMHPELEIEEIIID